MRSAGRGVPAARAAAAAAVLALLAGCSASAGEVRQPLVGGGATEGPNGRTVVPAVPVRMPRDLAVAQHASCSPDLSPGWLERENANGACDPPGRRTAPARGSTSTPSPPSAGRWSERRYRRPRALTG